jgi:hypothetical protein
MASKSAMVAALMSSAHLVCFSVPVISAPLRQFNLTALL